ncbi:MAG TPA: capsule assembly Wzi family protein [Terriglobales bacterium]|nr:capsule assembly Wzi family protein [Terriglobales bacterium]
MTRQRQVGILGAALLFSIVTISVSSAQEQAAGTAASENASEKHDPSTKAEEPPEANAIAKTHEGTQLGLMGRFLDDQRRVWTSPTKLRFSDTEWVVPFSGITAGLFVTDRDFSKHLSQSPTTMSHYKTMSNAGVAALVGGAGGMWLLGHAKHNEHWSETGFLAGESALNSLVMVEGLKYSLRRERPYQGNGSGAFFQSGGTSFPSEHAAAAWSVAGVIAHEYPGPLTKIMAYGLASLVDISRVKARQHFPSDVVVGSVIGNLVAQDIYSRHHDFDLGGGEWRSISQIFRGDGTHSPANQGSPYVPLDSWIYPALDRLAAMGLIDSGFAGMRPWTRRECARLLSEAEDKVGNIEGESTEAPKLVSLLERELLPATQGLAGDDNTAFRVESIYTRTEHISGMPLTDGYDFAQTQFNDFGRPYGEGWSTASGFSSYATSGRWVAYVRGEVQTAPSIPALPLSTREVIAGLDSLPLPPAAPHPAVTQAALLDAYVGLMVSDWQISFGRQSLWWGTGEGALSEGTSLDLSNNAQPIDMLRITRTTPLKLPSILGWLGPMKTEFFLGRLSGYEFIFSPLGLSGQWGQALADQPFIHGQHFGFKPTRNFEFGFYRTTIFGGEVYPFTTHALIASLFDTGNSPAGAADKPGKRTSGLDLSYRLPRLRNWVTLYADGFTYDEFSPIAYPTWSAWHSGMYFPHLPRLPKSDLRVEGVYTDIPKIGGANGPGTWYSNGTWKNGYTNKGNIMGSWVGRGGQGAQAWTNYWFNARSRLQLNFRHQKVSKEFVPGGGSLTDVGIKGDYSLRPNLSVSVSVQSERWLFPVIQPNASRNVTTAVQILFEPHKLFQHSSADAPAAALVAGDRP